jgi:hypothetical protein
MIAALLKFMSPESCNMIGENLDLTSGGDERPGKSFPKPIAKQPFVGVHFKCCDVYTRIYINRDATAYVGYCPRCAKKIELTIGPDGTDARFFEAS